MTGGTYKRNRLPARTTGSFAEVIMSKYKAPTTAKPGKRTKLRANCLVAEATTVTATD